MHLANSGRVIVRLNSEVPEGQILCDNNSQKIAKVTELIKFLRLIKLLQRKKAGEDIDEYTRSTILLHRM